MLLTDPVVFRKISIYNRWRSLVWIRISLNRNCPPSALWWNICSFLWIHSIRLFWAARHFTDHGLRHLSLRETTLNKNEDSYEGVVYLTPKIASFSGFAGGRDTNRASLFGTFHQTLPDLITPLKEHSLSPRSCRPTRSAPTERFGYYDCGKLPQ